MSWCSSKYFVDPIHSIDNQIKIRHETPSVHQTAAQNLGTLTRNNSNSATGTFGSSTRFPSRISIDSQWNTRNMQSSDDRNNMNNDEHKRKEVFKDRNSVHGFGDQGESVRVCLGKNGDDLTPLRLSSDKSRSSKSINVWRPRLRTVRSFVDEYIRSKKGIPGPGAYETRKDNFQRNELPGNSKYWDEFKKKSMMKHNTMRTISKVPGPGSYDTSLINTNIPGVPRMIQNGHRYQVPIPFPFNYNCLPDLSKKLCDFGSRGQCIKRLLPVLDSADLIFGRFPHNSKRNLEVIPLKRNHEIIEKVEEETNKIIALHKNKNIPKISEDINTINISNKHKIGRSYSSPSNISINGDNDSSFVKSSSELHTENNNNNGIMFLQKPKSKIERRLEKGISEMSDKLVNLDYEFKSVLEPFNVDDLLTASEFSLAKKASERATLLGFSRERKVGAMDALSDLIVHLKNSVKRSI